MAVFLADMAPSIYEGNLLATDTIPSQYDIVRIAGNGGAVTLTSTPSIANGRYDGQILWVFGNHETNLVTLQDVTNLAGSTLHLRHSHDVTLGKYDNFKLMWYLSAGIWIACVPVTDVAV